MIDTRNTTASAAQSANFRAAHRAAIGALGLLLAMMCTGFVAAAPLPSDVVTGSNPPDPKILDAYLQPAVQKLQSSTPEEQQAGRDEIIGAIIAPNLQPSAAFMYSYAGAVNTHLLSVTRSEDYRVRLNAAIAAARIADKAGGDQLVPLIQALLEDKHEAVALWAMKGGSAALRTKPQQMIPPIVAASKRFPSLTGQAYAAFSKMEKPSPEVIQAIQDLLRARIDLYLTRLPPELLAEYGAVSQLVQRAWWDAQTDPQKMATVQLLADLSAVIGQRVTSSSLTPDQRENLRVMVRQLGRSVSAIAVNDTTKAAMRNQVQSAINLPAMANAEQIKAAAATIHPALASGFPGMKPAPTVAANP